MWYSNKFNPSYKTALVIGSSQGVGADLALKLYEKGCSVILVARTKSKLIAQIENIKKRIGESSTASLSYISTDVSDYEMCVNLWEEITINRKQDPDYIFCCAGSSIPKLFSDLTPTDLSSGISINYSTALNVVHSGFKQILALQSGLQHDKLKRRHIIFFSSVVSFFPFIGYAQYAPMKAALTSLSLILRQELGPFNYRVSCVFPGNFQSEGFEEEQKTKPEITKTIEGPSHPISSEECADLIIRKLNRGYDTITTDFVGWALGCSVLGTLPREFAFFQIITSFLFSIFAPIVNWFIFCDIVKFFKKIGTEEEFEIVENQKKTN